MPLGTTEKKYSDCWQEWSQVASSVISLTSLLLMHPQRVRNNLELHGPMLQVINNPKGIRNPKLSLEAGIKATKKKKKRKKKKLCCCVRGGGGGKSQ